MAEDIRDRLKRLANGGRKPPVEPKREFVMPTKDQPVKPTKGYLEALLDEVDLKYTGKIR